MEHQSVMLQQAVAYLQVKPEGIYVDGTLGRGGHSAAILSQLTTGHLYGFDLDETALSESEARLQQTGSNFTLIRSNFALMKEQLAERGVFGADGVLLDIGVSSPQFDDPERGFSYRYDAPLDMRMDRQQHLNARIIVNEYPFNDLVRILRRYGEEPFAVQIARGIEKYRSEKPIETTGELVDIIKDALPAKVKNKPGHPAKQTFQALRIEVNDELNNLRAGLKAAEELLNPGGRLVVISFHSLEDEIVKIEFRNASQPPFIDRRIPLKQQDIPLPEFELITRKAVVADADELEENHRAHSARLRVLEKRRTL